MGAMEQIHKILSEVYTDLLKERRCFLWGRENYFFGKEFLRKSFLELYQSNLKHSIIKWK